MLIAIINIPKAFLKVNTFILLCWTVISFSFFINDFTAINKTAAVVVFIPPPVDAGDAPINISIIITNKVDSLNWVKSIVA